MARVIVAGVVGGLLVFAAGAFSHLALKLEGRAYGRLEDEAGLREYLCRNALAPGIYMFPQMAVDFDQMPADLKEKEWSRVSELYKQGPSANLIIAPTGEDVMGPKKLGLEALTDIVAALIAAWVVSRARGAGVLTRWLIVLLLGAFTWVSTSASFAIWYHFPWPFILDGLYCSLIEWGAAGVAIAIIVRPVRSSADPRGSRPGTVA